MNVLSPKTRNRITKDVYPFVKWVGGKRQLIPVFEKLFPRELKLGELETYVEPFVGGGAVLFHVLSNYPVRKAYIFDTNRNLIYTFQTVRDHVKELIEHLQELEYHYNVICKDDSCRRAFYYKIRDTFNAMKELEPIKAAYFIFLNRTCYNGLYRVNRKGDFNVPFGRYRNPEICNEENLLASSRLLQRVEMFCADYKESLRFVDSRTFVYFDPPYKPLTSTSNFTSYTEDGFGDEKQEELAAFFKLCHSRGALLMLSNSDPKQFNEQDDFFDRLYGEFTILRVSANRFVNSKPDKRGKISEIVVLNYPVPNISLNLNDGSFQIQRSYAIEA